MKKRANHRTGMQWPIFVIVVFAICLRLGECFLYVRGITKCKRLEYTLPEWGDGISLEELKEHFIIYLPNHQLTDIHFDKATHLNEVLQFPIEFFRDIISKKQLVEIVQCSRLKGLIDGSFMRGLFLSNLDELQEKVEAMQEKLCNILSEDTDSDAFVDNIPPSLYGRLNPYTALASSNFRMSERNIMTLFGIEKLTLHQDKVAMKGLSKSIRDFRYSPALLIDYLLAIEEESEGLWEQVKEQVKRYIFTVRYLFSIVL